MEIRHTIAPEMELIDAMDYVELGSMLAEQNTAVDDFLLLADSGYDQ